MSDAVTNPRHAVDAYVNLDIYTTTVQNPRLPTVVRHQTARGAGAAVLAEHIPRLCTLTDDKADVV